MPKIRGVKPDFWTDENIVELSAFARLLFIGLWNYACDNGHLQDKPKQIKRRILPDDDVNCSDLLREIETQGLIERADGWICVPNLTGHQKPDRRYWLTCDKEGCEPPPETVSQRAARRAHPVHTQGTPGAHDERTPGAHVDGDGEVMVKGSDGESSAGGAPRKRAIQLPESFKPSDAHLALAAEQGVDLRAEWPQFVDHHRAKGTTMKDWDAGLRTWIRNAAKFRRAPQPPPLRLAPSGAPIIPMPKDDVR